MTNPFACCSLPWDIQPVPTSAADEGSAKSRGASAISLDIRLERLLSGGQASNDGLPEASAANQPEPLSVHTPQTSLPASALPSTSDRQAKAKAPKLTDQANSFGSAKSTPLRPSLLRQGSSSASSSEELIGALHSPTHHVDQGHVASSAPRQPVKSPLPAPPTHLKVWNAHFARLQSIAYSAHRLPVKERSQSSTMQLYLLPKAFALGWSLHLHQGLAIASKPSFPW